MWLTCWLFGSTVWFKRRVTVCGLGLWGARASVPVMLRRANLLMSPGPWRDETLLVGVQVPRVVGGLTGVQGSGAMTGVVCGVGSGVWGTRHLGRWAGSGRPG